MRYVYLLRLQIFQRKKKNAQKCKQNDGTLLRSKKKKKKKTILIVESTISKETENSDLYKNTKACLDP